MHGIKKICYCVGVTATTALLVAASWPARIPECKVASAWVTAHRAELPGTLAEFRKYDAAYQHAIYVALPGVTRQAFWREHLEAVLTAGGLSAIQEADVRQILADLPAIVSDSTGRAARAWMRANHTNARLLRDFGTDRAMLLFSVRALGRASGAPLASNAEWQQPGGPSAAESARFQFCDCYTGSSVEDCGSTPTCVGGGCDRSTFGCGLLGGNPCDGLCKLT